MTSPEDTAYSFNLIAVRAVSTLAVFLLVGCGCTSPDTAREADTVDPGAERQAAATENALVVAVDGNELRQDELDRQVGYALSSQQMGGIPPEALGPDVLNQIRSEIIERFVSQHVLLSEAGRQGVEADEGDVEAAVTEITSGLPEGMTLADALQGYSMDETQFREELKKDLQIRALLETRTEDAYKASNEEIQEFYQESQQYFQVPATARTRHILVKVEDGDSPEEQAKKKEKAEALLAQLADGADFAQLAAEHSDCPSAREGGNLGELRQGQTVPAFEKAAFSQELNKPGPVVKTQFGYHVIEVQERAEDRVRPLEEVREDIERFLNDQKQQEVIEEYIQDLKGQSTIRYGDE